MKYAVSIMLVILAFVFITSTQGYFDALSFKAEKTVFANQYTSNDISVLAKPLATSGNEIRSKQDKQLRLMSYNIHRGINKNGKLDLDATSNAIRGVQPGIVALQEVERFSIRTGFKDQIKYLASQLGMTYAYGKSINVLNGEYGNGLLSIYPIEEYSTYELPSIGEQRTVLRTVVNIEGYKLAVYNTHLGLNRIERKEQLDYIMKLIEAEEIDYVLMGDMNSEVDKLEGITDIMKDSALGSNKEDQSTFVDNDVMERIDYVFLKKDVKVTNYNVVISEASDHYPVISEVVIEK